MRSIKEIDARIKRNESVLKKVTPFSDVYSIALDEINTLNVIKTLTAEQIEKEYKCLRDMTNNVPSVYIGDNMLRNRIIVYKWVLKEK